MSKPCKRNAKIDQNDLGDKYIFLGLVEWLRW
jgi:hypothetical protein